MRTRWANRCAGRSPAPTPSTAVSAAARRAARASAAGARVGAGDRHPGGAHGGQGRLDAAGTLAPFRTSTVPRWRGGVQRQPGQVGEVTDVAGVHHLAVAEGVRHGCRRGARRRRRRGGIGRPAHHGPRAEPVELGGDVAARTRAGGCRAPCAAAVAAVRSASPPGQTTTMLAPASRARDAARVAAAAPPLARGSTASAAVPAPGVTWCRPGRFSPEPPEPPPSGLSSLGGSLHDARAPAAATATTAAADRSAVRRGREVAMMDTSLTRPRAHQRVGDGVWRVVRTGDVPREPRASTRGTPRRWAASGRHCSGGTDPHRRARPVRDAAHRARRAGARPVLPAGARAAPARPAAAPRHQRAAPARRRWCSGPSTSGPRHLDIGQGDVPWVVLADPEGNPFCVMEERPEYATSGPIAALPLDSADPARDAAFWAELSGWQPVSSAMPAALRHPSGRGVLLELCPEPAPSADRPQEPAAPRHPPRGGRRRGRRRRAGRRARRPRARPRLGRAAVAGRHRPVRQRALPPARRR